MRKTLRMIGILAIIAAALFAVTGVFAGEGDTVDHSIFPQLQQEFASGPEVTTACLECHEDTATEVMATVHWTWEYTDPVTGQQLGKNNVVNNYCIAMPSNEPRCTSCHVGYGYSNQEFDFSAQEKVDCLVCHADTSIYKKFPAGSGNPWLGDEPKEFPPGSGKMWEKVDLAAAAQSVAAPTRGNCGSCHFKGGGGDAVKHGDLDSTMGAPAADLDVHMSPDTLNFTCSTCHAGESHEIKGRIYTGEEAVMCTDCHTGDMAPHADSEMGEALAKHAETIACQTCHVPEFARGKATKMTWDWSNAGEKNEDGKPFQTKNDAGQVIYDSKKGTFTWESNVTPHYAWWNGETRYLTPADSFDASEAVMLTAYQGSLGDGKIYPFKNFTGVTPYDAGNSTMAVPNLFPAPKETDTEAYWKSWDWDKALSSGMAYAGYEYSGELGFVDTVFMWVQNHQVAPAADAVRCQECHTDDGRLDFAALGYAPEKAAILMTFPPVEPTPEPEPTEVPTEEPTEEPEAVAEVVEEPVVEEEPEVVEEAVVEAEAPAEEAANLTWLWIVLAVVVVGGGAYFFTQKK